MLLGLVVGLLGLVVAPGAAFGLASWPPVEGPAWWIANSVGNQAHNWLELDKGQGARIEPTALNATSASFVAYVKPIAGVPVTYWNISVEAEPDCRGVEPNGTEEYEQCQTPDAQEQELMQARNYQFAEGEIVGGNPLEYVQLTASTLNGGHDGEETWQQIEYETELGPSKPFELLPGRVYRVFVYATPIKNSWLENSRLTTEPWLGPLISNERIYIFTPGAPVSNARLRREARQAAKKLKQEQRRKNRENHGHRP